MQKSVFVIGGTGVMGKFLVEKLLSRGVRVDAATLDDVKSEDAALRYYRQNFMDLRTLERFLSGRRGESAARKAHQKGAGRTGAVLHGTAQNHRGGLVPAQHKRQD